MWPAQAVRLRPLGVGERIDAAIKIVRANFLTLAKAALVVAVPSGLVVAIISVSVRSSSEQPVLTDTTSNTVYPALGAELLTLVITLIVSALVTAVCFRIIANAYLGQPADWREALRFGWSRLLPVIWISLLTYVGVVLVVLAIAVLIAIAVALHVVVFTVFFSVVLALGGFVATIWFLVASRLAVPVLLLENIRGIKAIRRALRLCRGYWWSVFGTQFLAGLLVGVASLVVALVIGAIFSVFHGTTISSVVDGFLVQTIDYVVFAPFSAAILVVLAIDLRVRKEGFDIELLSAQMGVPLTESALFFTKPSPGGGYGPAGYPPQGHPPQGYPPQPGWPQSGYPPPGYPQQPSPWYPPAPSGYPPPQPPPPPGWPRPSDSPPAPPPQANPPQANPPQSDPPQGYPPQGYPPQGNPPQSDPPQPGYPPLGYPQQASPWYPPSPSGYPPPQPPPPPGWPRPSDSRPAAPPQGSPPPSNPSPLPPTIPGWPRPSDSVRPSGPSQQPSPAGEQGDPPDPSAPDAPRSE